MTYEKTKNCSICNSEFIAKNCQKEVCSHQCHLKRRVLWHRKNGDKVRAKSRSDYLSKRKPYYKIYEKTFKGFIMRKYRNMQSRILGIQKLKKHLYVGKSLLSREDFYRWAFQSETLKRLYSEWVKSGYSRKLTPSVDRIDPKIGYEISNMEWVTHSENSRRSSITRHQMKI